LIFIQNYAVLQQNNHHLAKRAVDDLHSSSKGLKCVTCYDPHGNGSCANRSGKVVDSPDFCVTQKATYEDGRIMIDRFGQKEPTTPLMRKILPKEDGACTRLPGSDGIIQSIEICRCDTSLCNEADAKPVGSNKLKCRDCVQVIGSGEACIPFPKESNPSVCLTTVLRFVSKSGIETLIAVHMGMKNLETPDGCQSLPESLWEPAEQFAPRNTVLNRGVLCACSGPGYCDPLRRFAETQG